MRKRFKRYKNFAVVCVVCFAMSVALTCAMAQTDTYNPFEENTQKFDSIETSGDSALPAVHSDDDFGFPLLKQESRSTIISPLEKLYNTRVKEPLTQFGYDLFSSSQSQVPYMGAVQDDFILGVGDQLQITFAGQRQDQEIYTIASDGTLLIKDFAPIAAAGKTIGALTDILTARISERINTQIYVSLAKVRQINVLVAGNVDQPGMKTLSAFHTVLDALIQSGGVRKDGSLRNIKLVRGGMSTPIDLYDILISGRLPVEQRLQDGDRLIVPPINKTYAISGAVSRPGIYELSPELITQGIPVPQALEIAGGALAAKQNRFMILSPDKSGNENTQDIQPSYKQSLRNGDVLLVETSEQKRIGDIELTGETRAAGTYDLARYKKLSDILNAPQILGDDIYPLLGVIKRMDKTLLSARYIPFSPHLIISKKNDIPLQSGDKIIFFSKTEIKNALSNSPAQKTDPLLLHTLTDRLVTINGGVALSGSYPIADGETLEALLSAAGGLSKEANRSNIEIISAQKQNKKVQYYNLDTVSAASILLMAGDSIRVNIIKSEVTEKTVYITGEIISPGYYSVIAGDHVSDLIARAGGLTPEAYPDGAIFSRESERKTEESRYRAQAKEMERALAASLEQEKNKPDATQIAMIRELAQTLSTIEGMGRITIEANPIVLKDRPALDMLLEAGDRLYIPKRPLTVRVGGEVLSPASLQFISGKDPLDYIHEAGGFTYHADKDRAFVVFPNGSASPLRVNTWNHKPMFIPPGSTIIVPRDPKPFDFIESARDITQILSNLAVTAIFVDDIRN